MLAGWLAACLPADEAANGKSGHQKMTNVYTHMFMYL
ncbi:hypothetical protein L915_03079 [Phytophthora nicotianae]|uniref:Uncharacterized protein n=1 Tax=Phytophthora nicotianae TaxID=4792 RepID=W2HGR7_PHYNI|nr:hypothetical protein L915_03079 [Phytophthora nicotianae]